jgi:hypothetical protein
LGSLSLVVVFYFPKFDAVKFQFDKALEYSLFAPLEKVTFFHATFHTSRTLHDLQIQSHAPAWLVHIAKSRTVMPELRMCSLPFLR